MPAVDLAADEECSAIWIYGEAQWATAKRTKNLREPFFWASFGKNSVDFFM
jgi:hypothetical protein